MSNSNGHLYLKEKQLQDIIDFAAKKLVGRILKRMEIHNNIDVVRKEVKELIYENYRDLGDLIYTAGKGVDPLTNFNFNLKKTDS